MASKLAKLGLMIVQNNFTFFKNLLFGVENCDFEILTLSENMVFLQLCFTKTAQVYQIGPDFKITTF